ncbi:SGNH/GDSL hydrolase family protein [Cyclobacterium plantarum]|uniref:SGNH/GDSL hydrolase family protein n=1 Tax=Cyclobacterium plantarum TaxID=2716263 RepID=A0ABX0H1E0_9BACT|nr:SGNH/GDSL hydrolase family protein [Cyclobacterium plantarum]NHE55242.1 SGNH/GDSL hydrolase family protein [Cyclobacterium plantarum]
MYHFSLLTLLFGLLFSPLKAQEAYVIPPSAKKILFLGNSITYGGSYVSYVESYLRLTYPERTWDFINVGLPSETVSGLSEEGHAGGKFPRPDLHERLERILTAVKPDLIFSCYGMNDGIYLPFDEGRFEAYKKGQEKLHQKTENRGIPIIHLTPPVYDERKGAAYANTLAIYASWLMSKKYTQNWMVIDLHWPMRKFLEDKRDTHPDFVLAADGIHPGDQGHWIMAKSLLKGLGEQENLDTDLPEPAFRKFPQGLQILALVEEKQRISKDAWISHIGHERPGMKEGVPLPAAQSRSAEIIAAMEQILK